MMRKFILLAVAAMALLVACHKSPSEQEGEDTKPAPHVQTPVPAFAKGADISWLTEMEQKGYKFYSQGGGEALECTALMKQIGCNAVRYRVWVNPAGGWCNKEDVLEKAKRAQELGMAIMIDFHYSDSWADPSQQTIPAAWAGKDLLDMCKAVANHTTEVLQLLKDNEIDVAWVQVGNETNTGMLWPTGSLSSSNYDGFCALVNAGYDSVKAVYPDALVLLHHSNAQDLGNNRWFFNLVKYGNAKYDMIGLSLYPSYWDDKIKAYPDWKPYCEAAVSNFKILHTTYSKPVMLVEFGMPVASPAKAEAALQYVMDGVAGNDWFKGIFYWEPESEQGRNGYAYGAFSGGKPTAALSPFKDK